MEHRHAFGKPFRGWQTCRYFGQNLGNRAIHGGEISPENASKFIDTAIKALSELEYVILNHALKTAKTEVVDMDTFKLYSDAKYLLTTIIPYANRPEKKTYKVNQAELDAFLEDYDGIAEFIIELKKISGNDKQE